MFARLGTLPSLDPQIFITQLSYRDRNKDSPDLKGPVVEGAWQINMVSTS
jgi:hypothetical protein